MRILEVNFYIFLFRSVSVLQDAEPSLTQKIEMRAARFGTKPVTTSGTPASAPPAAAVGSTATKKRRGGEFEGTDAPAIKKASAVELGEPPAPEVGEKEVRGEEGEER